MSHGAPQSPPGEQPTFHYHPTPWFNLTFVALLNVVGLMVVLCILVLFLVLFLGGILLIGIGADEGSALLIASGIIMAIAALPCFVLFNPLINLNPFVTSVSRSRSPVPFDKETCHIVQVSFQPRLAQGLQAVLEDADDIGLLCFEPGAIAFHGGAFHFRIPYSACRKMESRLNVFPGLLMSGRRLEVFLGGNQGMGRVKIHNRRGWTTIGQLHNSGKIIRMFRERLPHCPYEKHFI